MKYVCSIINTYRKLFWSKEKYARYKGVKIGQGCNIQTINWGTEPYLIEIGDNTQITKGVSFYTHGGSWVFRKKISQV
jgi:acetyltransferase-like isoleucine patch superfamily enzyme